MRMTTAKLVLTGMEVTCYANGRRAQIWEGHSELCPHNQVPAVTTA
jgi:hypothetical protein